ncbi:MAG: terminase large subunit [Gammaproteobacteria bacterium]|nr:terminase large subunit [Gammaproteobacteria bacterium]
MNEYRDIVAWAESEHGFYIPETREPIKLTSLQKKILRHCFTPNSAGAMPYQTILYSCPKKSGKSTLGALVALWWALLIEAPNEIFIAANDLDQAQGRVFKALTTAIRLNPHLKNVVDVSNRRASFSTGTVVEALAADFKGAAGSNHGLTIWDECWAYTSEASRRLWDELTPVPTRKNSVRLCVTYAGFPSESELLWQLHQRSMGGTPVEELSHLDNGDGKPACRAADGLFSYWDHSPRMPWQTEDYLAAQKSSLRANAYLRLHENRWIEGNESFINLDWWDNCTDYDYTPLLPNTDETIFLGVDASTKGDSSAVVACQYDWDAGKVRICRHRVWQPSKSQPLNIDQTIGDYIRELHTGYHIAGVHYDPYQLHDLATRLQGEGVHMVEFPQSVGRLTQLGQNLYELIKHGNLVVYPDHELRLHISNAIATESSRGWRLSKTKRGHKIDLAVALGMACWASMQEQSQPFRVIAAW